MLRNLFSRFARDERGVTLVEYGVGVTLAVVVGITLLTALGSGINGNLIDAAGAMDATGCNTDADGVVTCNDG